MWCWSGLFMKITSPLSESSPNTNPLPTDGIIALLILYVLWGSTYLAIKYALFSFPPFLLGGTRFPLAGALMYGILRLRHTPNPTRNQLLHCAVYGLLLIGGGNGLIAFAEQYVSSGLTAAFLAVQPLTIALMSGLFGRWPNKLEWTGIAIGMIGTLLLATEGEMRAHPVGLIALIVAILCWSFGSALARHRLDLPGGPMTTAIELFSGGVLQLVLSWGLGEHLRTPIAPQAWAGWLYLVVASIIGFTSYTIVLRRLRPVLAASFAYVNPAVALALGYFVAGETVTSTALLGVAIIIAGVLAISLAKQTAPR